MMSALPSKADMCSAARVCFVPIADIAAIGPSLR